jgi:flagellar biosynthesis/type III secretory pathway M-ring protein FliF/YscJ
MMLGGPGTIGPMEIGDEVSWLWSVATMAFVVLVVALTWFSAVWGRNSRPASDERDVHQDAEAEAGELGRVA